MQCHKTKNYFHSNKQNLCIAQYVMMISGMYTANIQEINVNTMNLKKKKQHFDLYLLAYAKSVKTDSDCLK